jgi:DNA-binding response OmpR family regulator
MIRMLLVNAESEFPSDFTAVLENEGARIVRVRTQEEALSKTSDGTFDLVVIDEKLPDATGLDCAQTLISSDAFLNCAVVSALSPEEFHEASEGLGLLMQLPAPPGREEAGKLLERLKKILNLTNVKGI